MKPHRIVDPDVWRGEHQSFLRREKQMTQALDELAAARRRLPATSVEKDYEFHGPNGTTDLCGLFDGRSQLIVYHHMLKPDDAAPCAGCGMVGDQIPHLAHLHARDTSLVFVSRAPIAEIEVFRKRMGWQMPWFETKDSFNVDFDVTDGFGLNVFLREGGDCYRTYFITGRGVEKLGTAWTFLDLTPLGRQETWEDSPDGIPQTEPYQWWKLHDEYSV